MTNKQLAAFLRRYNQWRRDDEGVMTMPHPKDIGEAIDKAIAVIESHSALIGLLRRWMPVIEAHVEASHLTDGLKRKANESDALLEQTKSEIEK